jgi:3-hydroxyisobutyrate dehydrogenase-like beta-hydroxyacid dehydrogenase
MTMAITTVGLLSPGDMGHSIGAVLRSNGLQVLTCLQGRSARTRALAEQSGFDDCGSLEELVTKSDIILCVLVPARATAVARQVADAIRVSQADVLYVDCNAISPQTVRGIADLILSTGARFADVGIVGPPPRKPGTRFYTSGPGAAEFAELKQFGLDARVIGGEPGQASGLKMCYGALTKGLLALSTELLIAARLMGLEETLRSEQQESMSEVVSWLERQLPTMPPKAYRWVGEMEEIASTFAHLGLTPNILTGAADMYRMVEQTPIGKESPENRDPNRDMYGVVAALADALAEPVATRT